MSQHEDSSDSDYVVEEYIRPTTTRVPVRNDETADVLGNFKDLQPLEKKYHKFPKEVFSEDYDHDKQLVDVEVPPKKVKVKTALQKKKIRKKILAKMGMQKKLADAGT